jgi:hypothetical protein
MQALFFPSAHGTNTIAANFTFWVVAGASNARPVHGNHADASYAYAVCCCCCCFAPNGTFHGAARPAVMINYSFVGIAKTLAEKHIAKATTIHQVDVLPDNVHLLDCST